MFKDSKFIKKNVNIGIIVQIFSQAFKTNISQTNNNVQNNKTFKNTNS